MTELEASLAALASRVRMVYGPQKSIERLVRDCSPEVAAALLCGARWREIAAAMNLLWREPQKVVTGCNLRRIWSRLKRTSAHIDSPPRATPQHSAAASVPITQEPSPPPSPVVNPVDEAHPIDGSEIAKPQHFAQKDAPTDITETRSASPTGFATKSFARPSRAEEFRARIAAGIPAEAGQSPNPATKIKR
jgi:hypothetical protein